jgi:hypothetical protein
MDEYKIGDYLEVIKDNDEIMICIIDRIDDKDIITVPFDKVNCYQNVWLLPLYLSKLTNAMLGYITKAYRKLSNEEVLQWKMEQ